LTVHLAIEKSGAHRENMIALSILVTAQWLVEIRR
jgi:hypothetical protein